MQFSWKYSFPWLNIAQQEKLTKYNAYILKRITYHEILKYPLFVDGQLENLSR